MSYAMARGGNPDMVVHVHRADVVAGTPIIQGISLFIPHVDAKSGQRDKVAAGGGMYWVPKAAEAINEGVRVYWDDTAKNVTTTSAGNTHIGNAVGQDYASGDSHCYIHHIANIA